jgi:Domain of unknown function (DUF4416)
VGNPKEPRPAKYFVAVLSTDAELLTAIEADLSAMAGPIDARSEILPWTISRFYEKEMGSGLLRRFLSFSRLMSPGDLVEMKLQTQRVEDTYRDKAADPPGRRVNLDPGYVEAGKVVLASTKNAGHRIYLQSGIYGESTLLYYDGAFHGFSYTYPDYLWPEALRFLTAARVTYLAQVKGYG